MSHKEQSILQRIFGASFIKSTPLKNNNEKNKHKNSNSNLTIDTILEENENNPDENEISTLYSTPVNSPRSSRGNVSSNYGEEMGYTSSHGSINEDSDTSVHAGVPLHRSHEQSNLRRHMGMQWFDYLVNIFPYSLMGSRSRKSIPLLPQEKSSNENTDTKRQASVSVTSSGKKHGRKSRRGTRNRGKQTRKRSVKIVVQAGGSEQTYSNSDISDNESSETSKCAQKQKRTRKCFDVKNPNAGPSTESSEYTAPRNRKQPKKESSSNQSCNNSRYNLRPRNN